MDDVRLGFAVRAIRIKRGWSQTELAAVCGVSRSTISRLERGHLDSLTLETLRRICGALDIRLDIVARWRSGDLDRLTNAAHASMHESMVAEFDDLSAWV